MPQVKFSSLCLQMTQQSLLKVKHMRICKAKLISLFQTYKPVLCNRLTLNPAKTCYQLYSLFPAVQDINISLNNSKIKRSYTVKYLGILMDENLKWDSHISYICTQISRDICFSSMLLFFVFFPHP